MEVSNETAHTRPTSVYCSFHARCLEPSVDLAGKDMPLANLCRFVDPTFSRSACSGSLEVDVYSSPKVLNSKANIVERQRLIDAKTRSKLRTIRQSQRVREMSECTFTPKTNRHQHLPSRVATPRTFRERPVTYHAQYLHRLKTCAKTSAPTQRTAKVLKKTSARSDRDAAQGLLERIEQLNSALNDISF